MKSKRNLVDPKKAVARINDVIGVKYYKLAERSEEFQITNLLSDIQHWCDAHEVHYVRAEDIARELYAQEVIDWRKAGHHDKR